MANLWVVFALLVIFAIFWAAVSIRTKKIHAKEARINRLKAERKRGKKLIADPWSVSTDGRRNKPMDG